MEVEELNEIGGTTDLTGVIAASPEGRYLYVTGLGDVNLAVIDVIPLDPTVVGTMSPLSDFQEAWGIAISPDGDYAYVGYIDTLLL